MIDAEFVEHSDHDAPDVIAGSVGIGKRRDQSVQTSLGVTVIQGLEGCLELGLARAVLEADPGREAVGSETAGDAIEHGQCRVAVTAGVEDASQRHSRVSARRFELNGPAQGRFVTGGHEPVGFGGHELVEEAFDGNRRLDADELRDDIAIAERLDGRDALNPVATGEILVGVDIDLGELDLTRTGRDGLLKSRSELPAGSAPLGPEVDHHRDDGRAVKDRDLEVRFGYVDHHSDGSQAVAMR